MANDLDEVGAFHRTATLAGPEGTAHLHPLRTITRRVIAENWPAIQA